MLEFIKYGARFYRQSTTEHTIVSYRIPILLLSIIIYYYDYEIGQLGPVNKCICAWCLNIYLVHNFYNWKLLSNFKLVFVQQ